MKRINSDSATILALMSGTSVDTIDAAICKVSRSGDGRLGCDVLSFHEQEMSSELRQRIFTAFADGEHSLSLGCSLNFEIGRAFAEAANAAIRAWGQPASAIDAIASHGQTLYHVAPHMATAQPGRWTASTLQVGEPSIIALETGIPVISNFRVADMAAGGNGAPLVPFADYHLFTEPGRGVVVHNLGGIANCTYLPASSNADEVIAFDTGPANMIIDALTSHFYPGESYDHDGQHAAAGTVNESLLSAWMSEPYISLPPPKSTGRELFGVQFVEQILKQNPDLAADDLIATATEFTVQSLAANLRQHIFPRGGVDRLLLAGGGARNGLMTKRFQEVLGREIADITTLDEAHPTVNSKSRECAGFALMGYAHLAGLPCNLPSVTGASRQVILGQFTPVP